MYWSHLKKQRVHFKPLTSPGCWCVVSVQHHNSDSLTSHLFPHRSFISISICHQDKSPHTGQHWLVIFGAKSCGKTAISLSAILHCWVWTNEMTTAARVAQWQTAYSATSSVAGPQGPGSDLFPELHLSLSLTLSPPSSASLYECPTPLSRLKSLRHDSIKFRLSVLSLSPSLNDRTCIVDVEIYLDVRAVKIEHFSQFPLNKG